jgi:hypothetical protein
VPELFEQPAEDFLSALDLIAKIGCVRMVHLDTRLAQSMVEELAELTPLLLVEYDRPHPTL